MWQKTKTQYLLKAPFFTVAFLFFITIASGQDTTHSATDAKHKHSPRVATIASAIIPGAGQIYNSIGWKKTWWKKPYIKVPFIYGGFYVLGKYTSNQHYLYSGYKNAYNLMKDDQNISQITVNERTFSKSNLLNIQESRNEKRRSRDIGIIGISAWYILNIIDANIDAHFFYYDVNDDLSIEITPKLFNNYSNSSLGVSLRICIQ